MKRVGRRLGVLRFFKVPYHLALVVAAGLLAWSFVAQIRDGFDAIQTVTSQTPSTLSKERAELRWALPALLPKRDDWSDGR